MDTKRRKLKFTCQLSSNTLLFSIVSFYCLYSLHHSPPSSSPPSPALTTPAHLDLDHPALFSSLVLFFLVLLELDINGQVLESSLRNGGVK